MIAFIYTEALDIVALRKIDGIDEGTVCRIENEHLCAVGKEKIFSVFCQTDFGICSIGGVVGRVAVPLNT